MIFSLPFPYQCSNPLPAPLPSVPEIENCSNVLSDRTGSRLVAVDKNYVIRYGLSVHQREGNNLFFAEQHLKIAVPHLYAMFRDERDRTFIVMQRLFGVSLASLWPTLTDEEKNMAMKNLKSILDQMREYKPTDPDFFGSIDGSCVPYHLLWTKDKDPTISGPFRTEHDFNMGFVNKLRQIWDDNGGHSYRVEYFAAHLSDVLRDHRAVFTYGDIQRQNIIVRQRPDDCNVAEKRFDVVLVDWVDSGWFPSYWEYFSAFTAFQWVEDWPMKLGLAVEPCAAETAQMYMIYQDLWF